MVELKTKQNDLNVSNFLEAIPDEKRKRDSHAIMELMKRVTGMEASMWGDSIVGFGKYHYTYESGRSGEWFMVGFSPRKQNLTLYIMTGFDEFKSLLQRLGKHKTSKSCLYIKKLEDVDVSVLQELISKSFNKMSEQAS